MSERTAHLESRMGYIVEGPKCIHIAYICDLDRFGSPRGLFLRLRKDQDVDPDTQMCFTRIPGNVDWRKGRRVSIHQIKATLTHYSPTLKFWAYEYSVGQAAVESLAEFYAK